MTSANVSQPRALITGITGQDGSYLTELLLEKGYEVHGLVRRTSLMERSRLKHLYDDKSIYGSRFHLHYADLEDTTSTRRILSKVNPSEIYHLAGQSHVGLSFEIPESTCETTAMGTLRLLEMIRDLPSVPRFFHAASSEIFGKPEEMPQKETTAINPLSPYACAKAFAVNMVRIYRNSFGVFGVNGILYNHESPRRGEGFVTRKICRSAARIAAGVDQYIQMGDVSAERDWGYAPDYVKGMWLSLQHNEPGDYVFATGILHTVKDILIIAFSHVGLDWEKHFRFDERFMRPAEPSRLVGDPSRTEKTLGWTRTRTFEQIISEMVEHEMKLLK